MLSLSMFAATMGGGSAALSVGNQTFYRGAKTKAGAFDILPEVASSGGGGIASVEILSGDASSHFNTNSGANLYPSTTGDTADMSGGTYALSCRFTGVDSSQATATITVVCTGNEPNSGRDLDNSYSASTSAQIIAALNDYADAADQNILIAGGSYTELDLEDYTLTNRVTITPHDGESTPTFASIIYDNSDNITLDGIDIDFTPSSGTALLLSNGSSGIQLYNMLISGAEFDLNGDYSSSGSPTAAIGIGVSGTIPVDIDMQGVTVEYFTVGANIKASSSISITEDCEFRYNYEDGWKISHQASGAYPSVTIRDTVMRDNVGLDTDNGNPHCDGGQFLADSSNTNDWENVLLERVRVLETGVARGQTQGIFARFLSPVKLTVNCSTAFTTVDQTVTSSSGGTAKLVAAVSVSGSVEMQLYNVTGDFNVSDTLTGASEGSATLSAVTKAAQNYFTPTIRDCFVQVSMVGAVYVASPGDGTLIEGLTVVGKDNESGAAIQAVRIGEYGKPSGASVIVRDTVAEDIETLDGTSITTENNLELGNNGASNPYEDSFDGVEGVFNAPGSLATAMSMYAMKDSGDLEKEPTLPNIGAIGTGYVDFDAGTTDHPRRESGYTVGSNFTVDEKTQITGISATGALVTVSSGNFDVYDTDSSTLIASAQTSYIVDNNQYVEPNSSGVTINVGTSSGTVQASYTEQLIDNQGNARLERGADLTGASDSTTQLIFMSLVFNATASGNQYLICGADGDANLRVRRNSSGYIDAVWENHAGAAAVSMIGATNVIGAERCNILIAMNNNGTSYLYVWENTNGWTQEATDAGSDGSNLDFTTGELILGSFNTSGIATPDADYARIAIWRGITLPDITNSGARDNFANSSTGVTVDPAISVAAYGTPVVDIYGAASAWNAGTNQGSGGDFTAVNTFVAA